MPGGLRHRYDAGPKDIAQATRLFVAAGRDALDDARAVEVAEDQSVSSSRRLPIIRLTTAESPNGVPVVGASGGRTGD